MCKFSSKYNNLFLIAIAINVSFSIMLVLSQSPQPVVTLTAQPQSNYEQELLQGYSDMFPSYTSNNVQNSVKFRYIHISVLNSKTQYIIL